MLPFLYFQHKQQEIAPSVNKHEATRSILQFHKYNPHPLAIEEI
jgi:hypothetical protein